VAHVSWGLALLGWALTPWAVYAAGYVIALAYGGNAYRDNPAEVAAYDRQWATKES